MDPCWENQKPSGNPPSQTRFRGSTSRMPSTYETTNQIDRSVPTIRRFARQ
jgi:hypothetical protein